MSNNSRGAAERIPPVKPEERRVTLAKSPKDFIVDSPSLVAEDWTASHVQAKPDKTGAPHTPPPGVPRAVWFLTGWLAVSMTLIAIAGIVIARYF